MADRIRLQTEQMEEIRAKLLELSGSLSTLGARISGVEIDRASGSDVQARLSPSSFSCIKRSIDGGKVSECIDDLARATRQVGEYAHELAGSVGKVADVIEETENALAARFAAMGVGEGSLFENVCHALGISPDTSSWSLQTRRQFAQMQQEGKLVFEDGMAWLQDGGSTFLIGATGLIAAYKPGNSGSGGTMWLNGSGGTSGKLTWDGGIMSSSVSAVFSDAQGGSIEVEAKQGILSGVKTDKIDIVEQEKHPFYSSSGKDGQKPEKVAPDVDILSVSSSLEYSRSAASASGSFEEGALSGEGSIGLGNWGVEASATGGLGVLLPDENGKMQLYAGVDVQAGMSVSALDMSGSLKYELIDGVDIYTEGSAKVLTADVAAGLSVGIIGGKVTAYAEAGAQANLVEVEGKAGVDLAGVKGEVGGKVTVGIGAQAKVGYRDGVLSFEVGAALGVGVSVNAELDISGAVENVTEAIGGIGEAIGDAGEAIGGAISDVGNAVSDFVGGICAWF